MNRDQFASTIVHNDTEFYITIAKFRKPVKIKPYPSENNEGIILSEMECKALVVPPGLGNKCQCCSDDFPPPYPFVVEEV